MQTEATQGAPPNTRRPVWWYALALTALYTMMVGVFSTVAGIDYSTQGGLVATPQATLRLIAVEAGYAVVLAGVVSWLGWWRPVLVENPALRLPRWYLTIPILYLVCIALGINYGAAAALGGGHLALIVVAMLLVGFSEELGFRGLAVVSLRGGLPEWAVWLVSSLLFGLIHFANIAFGFPLVETTVQVVLAAVGASAYYVARRSIGYLWPAMLMHAGFDFMTLVNNGRGNLFATIPTLLEFVTVILLLVTWRIAFRKR